MSDTDETQNNIRHEQANNVHVGDFLLINGFPCKVVNLTKSKTGKHGGCKIHFVGLDIFTQKKYDTIYKSGDNVAVPIISKCDYTLVDISDDDPAFLSLIDNAHTMREDTKLPDNELGNKIKEEFKNRHNIIVTVLKSMDREMIISYKIDK